MYAVMIYERPCTRSGQDQWQAHEHVREGVSNALRFATVEEAKAYGADLASRWFGFDHWDVVELDAGGFVKAVVTADDAGIIPAGTYWSEFAELAREKGYDR